MNSSRLNFHVRPYSAEILDLLTLVEPLACVQHAYQRLPETLKVSTAKIFGGGPIGVLHVIELRRRFPGVQIQLVDPSLLRRSIAKALFQDVEVVDQMNGKSDLSIVATSDPIANLHAIETTNPMGVVIHFSGLNHKSLNDLVSIEGMQIEKIHRNEEVRVLSNGIRLIGSSGYSRADIARAITSLKGNPGIYNVVQTSVVDGIGSKVLFAKSSESRLYPEPVITTLLRSGEEYLRELKTVFRVRKEDRPSRVVPKFDKARYSAIVTEQEAKRKIPPGYVRLEMLRFSICNTDRRVLDGTKAATLSESLVLGHEGVGNIVEVGEGVSEKIREQGVSLILPHFNDHDDPLLKNGIPYLSLRLKHLGIHLDGCFATYVDVPCECVFAVESVLLARNECETKVA